MKHRGIATAVVLSGMVATAMAQSAGPSPKGDGQASVSSKVPTPKINQVDLSGGPNNGYYCLPNITGGLGVHDLGWIGSGSTVRIQVDRDSTIRGAENFDPAAAVLFIRLGRQVGDTVTTRFAYDDDSGGDLDPRIEFTAPGSGTYMLVVNDFTDAVAGCYRYRVEIS